MQVKLLFTAADAEDAEITQSKAISNSEFEISNLLSEISTLCVSAVNLTPTHIRFEIEPLLVRLSTFSFPPSGLYFLRSAVAL